MRGIRTGVLEKEEAAGHEFCGSGCFSGVLSGFFLFSFFQDVTLGRTSGGFRGISPALLTSATATSKQKG